MHNFVFRKGHKSFILKISKETSKPCSKSLLVSTKALITRFHACTLQLSFASFWGYVSSSFLRSIKASILLLWWRRGWWISSTLNMANSVVLVNTSACSYVQHSVCGVYDSGRALSWSFWCLANSLYSVLQGQQQLYICFSLGFIYKESTLSEKSNLIRHDKLVCKLP